MIDKLADNRVYRSYLGGSRIDEFLTGLPGKDGSYPEDWLASTVEAFNPGHEIPGEGLGRTVDGRLIRDLVPNGAAHSGQAFGCSAASGHSGSSDSHICQGALAFSRWKNRKLVYSQSVAGSLRLHWLSARDYPQGMGRMFSNTEYLPHAWLSASFFCEARRLHLCAGRCASCHRRRLSHDRNAGAFRPDGHSRTNHAFRHRAGRFKAARRSWL